MKKYLTKSGNYVILIPSKERRYKQMTKQEMVMAVANRKGLEAEATLWFADWAEVISEKDPALMFAFETAMSPDFEDEDE